jgi:hypothetical protein
MTNKRYFHLCWFNADSSFNPYGTMMHTFNVLSRVKPCFLFPRIMPYRINHNKSISARASSKASHRHTFIWLLQQSNLLECIYSAKFLIFTNNILYKYLPAEINLPISINIIYFQLLIAAFNESRTFVVISHSSFISIISKYSFSGYFINKIKITYMTFFMHFKWLVGSKLKKFKRKKEIERAVFFFNFNYNNCFHTQVSICESIKNLNFSKYWKYICFWKILPHYTFKHFFVHRNSLQRNFFYI